MSSENLRESVASSAAPVRNQRARTKILVVDDSLVGRLTTGRILEQRPDLQAIYATDGNEALVAIAREAPAVVLTDLQMPHMDGLSLVAAVRRRHARIPVILMTAYGSEDAAIKALRAGAANYVPKQDLARDLLETLDKVLSVRALDQSRQRVLTCLETRYTYFRLRSEPELINPLAILLQEELDAVGFCDETARVRVGIAVTEALANAIFHGNLEVSSDLRQVDESIFYGLAEQRRTEPPYRDRHVHVVVKLDQVSVAFEIRDEGPGFDRARIKVVDDAQNVTRIGGRGLLLIYTFMDDVIFNESGNQVTLVKRRSPVEAMPA